MNGKQIIKTYKETKKSSLIVYLVLRILVIICVIMQFLAGNYDNMLLAVLSLILFTIPNMISNRFKIEIPSLLESIIYIFIFASEILGEVNNFYGIIPYWDTMLHTLNGFLCAGVGLSLVDILNKNSRKIKLSPIYMVIVAFCFSMTVGVMWEFFEYGADRFFGKDMQKDTIVYNIKSVALNEEGKNKPVIVNDIESTTIKQKDGNEITINGYLDIGLNDTMKDLFVNFIGAVIFSIFGFFYFTYRKRAKFVTDFIPRKKQDTKDI